MLDAERHEVVEACHRLARAGMVPGSAGNVSSRNGSLIAVTPSGAPLAELADDDVCIVDLDDGLQVDGELPATSELELHLAVYRRYATGAIVHTHAPASVAVACTLDELPCVHYQMLELGGTVSVAPYATFGTSELAENVVASMDGRAAALMANHGAVTHADTVAGALQRMEVLEWACTVYRYAVTLGTPRRLSDEQLGDVASRLQEISHGTRGSSER